MQFVYSIQIDTAEDMELMECTKDILYDYKKKIKEPFRPTEFVYNLLNRSQKKIHDLLYEKELCECPICYEPIDYKNEVTTNCNHTFCKECIEKISNMTSSCPCCRTDLSYYNTTFDKSEIYILILIHQKYIFLIIRKKTPIFLRRLRNFPTNSLRSFSGKFFFIYASLR
jgi:hypothetical protein